jgi:fructose/tagatose bisphosphate aldolase
MLVTLQEIVAMAEQGNYCVPAFNFYNTETVMGIIEAAEELKAPVILQIYPRLINGEVGYYLSPSALAAAEKATVPVCLHLDHAASKEEVYKCLRWGYTGIMQDGSSLSFEENVALTRSTVEMCGILGIGVEGEIGHVGFASDDTMGEFTDPAEAKEFVEKKAERVVVKSKSAQKGMVELNLELRLKDDDTDFVNALSDMQGVSSAILVSYNGEYMN